MNNTDYYKKWKSTTRSLKIYKYIKIKEEPVGFTSYQGNTNPDKLYPKIHNFHTALLCQILLNQEHLKEQINILKEQLRQDFDLDLASQLKT